MPQFVTMFALICNKTEQPQFVIHIYFCYWVLLLLLQPLWFRVKVSHPPTHVTQWSCELNTTIESRDSLLVWSRFIPKKMHLQFHNANDHQTWWGLWVRLKGLHLLFLVTCWSSDYVHFEKRHVSTNARPQSWRYQTWKNSQIKTFFFC